MDIATMAIGLGLWIGLLGGFLDAPKGEVFSPAIFAIAFTTSTITFAAFFAVVQIFI